MRSKQLWDLGQMVDRDVRTKMRCQRGDKYQLVLIQAKKKSEARFQSRGKSTHPQPLSTVCLENWLEPLTASILGTQEGKAKRTFSRVTQHPQTTVTLLGDSCASCEVLSLSSSLSFHPQCKCSRLSPLASTFWGVAAWH